MILIADSGTTKTEWCILTPEGVSETVITSGINPFYQDASNISAILKNEFTYGVKKFDSIFFYGAGCTNKEKEDIVRTALLEVFTSDHMLIGSDLLAAARSLCQDRPGIACILGTGSNSCLYNGSIIAENVSPLGFILGDEGSGAVMGKQLISDVLKKQISPDLIKDFFETFPTTATEILENVYRKPFPSRYLAGFTRFLSKNIHHPEIEQIVINSLRKFAERNLLQYTSIESTPVHFTGSIAFFFKLQLSKVLAEQNLILGNVVHTPMGGLIAYHQNSGGLQTIKIG